METYICLNCKKPFDEPFSYTDTHGLEGITGESVSVCPYCKESEFEPACYCFECEKPFSEDEVTSFYVAENEITHVCYECQNKILSKTTYADFETFLKSSRFQKEYEQSFFLDWIFDSYSEEEQVEIVRKQWLKKLANETNNGSNACRCLEDLRNFLNQSTDGEYLEFYLKNARGEQVGK